MTPDPAQPAGVSTRPEAIKAIPVRHPGRWLAVAVILLLAAMFVHMLLTNPQFHWHFIWSIMFTAPVLAGARTTILLTVLAMLIGVTLGVIAAVMRLSPNRVLSTVAFTYTWFFRAVPRLLLCVMFGSAGILYRQMTLGLPFEKQLGNLLGLNVDATILSVNMNTLLTPFLAGLFALGLSEGAYMAEIVRAGILSVGEGQAEAATALGMSRGLTMRRVVLPQAMRVIVPPTGNEVIAMLKDTALVAYVPYADLFFNFEAIGNRTFQLFPALVAALIWYLAMSSVLLAIQYFIEKRFNRGLSRTANGGPEIAFVNGTGKLIMGGESH